MPASDRSGRRTVGRVTLRAETSIEAAEARRTFSRRLTAWECERLDDALLVFAELVTNAVRHAGGATLISVIHGAQSLRFEVHDGSDDAPVARHGSDHSGGFGLRIVSQLCEHWGWDQTADGKVVWCDLPCCRTESAEGSAVRRPGGRTHLGCAVGRRSP